MGQTRLKALLARRGLRTGILSAASDNDPTAVASLAVVGSTTTYGLGGPVLLEYLKQIP
jgi:hypothetical protein